MTLQIHNAIGWLLVLGTLAMVGFWVPPGVEGLGESYLIFFFHFPSAINCLNFFLIAGGISLVYIVRGFRRQSLDLWSASAIEVGVLACTITLITGSIWAKAAWGVFWDFRDKRLLTVAIMWFTYLGYLALRSAADEPQKRARFCAVFAVVAAFNVPIVYYSIQWFGGGLGSHPMEVELDEASMKVTQWGGALAFFVLYTALWRMRYRLASTREETLRLEDAFGRSGI